MVKQIILLSFLLCGYIPINSFADLILENNYQKVGIITEGRQAGGIFLIENKSFNINYTTDTTKAGIICFLQIGDFQITSSKIQFRSKDELILENNYSLLSKAGSSSLNITINYFLKGDRLLVKFYFSFYEEIRLTAPIEICSKLSAVQRIVPYNQYSQDQIIDIHHSEDKYYQALNQIYNIQTEYGTLNFVASNPFKSLVEIFDQKDGTVAFSFIVLPVYEPWKAFDPKGPSIASLLEKNVILNFEYELFLNDEDFQKEFFAYFSPFPSGFDQVISMIFDEVPFYRWIIPPTNNPKDISGQNELIQLLSDHPKMKMGWVMIPDPITSPDALVNPDYPKGKWWLAHGVHRMAIQAPAEYKRWLQHIEQDSIVLGYEDRVHLGVHGYHHTPEMLFGKNWEFQTYDSLRDERTLDLIEEDVFSCGLTNMSLQFIRFPGFKFSRSILDALAHHQYSVFDFDMTWEIVRLPLFPYYVGAKRLWGISANWEGDTPLSYETMKAYLNKGKWVHTAGHPIYWFNYGDQTAYSIRSQIFANVEQDFPQLGYVYLDQFAVIANEIYDARDFQYSYTTDEIAVSFTGQFSQNETIVVQPIELDSLIGTITVDNLPIQNFRAENSKLFLVLPQLENGAHNIKIPYKDSAHQILNTEPIRVFPNPSLQGQSIYIQNLPEDSEVLILNENGAFIKSLRLNPKVHNLTWDLTNQQEKRVASGIYICVIKGSKSDQQRIVKIAVIN